MKTTTGSGVEAVGQFLKELSGLVDMARKAEEEAANTRYWFALFPVDGGRPAAIRWADSLEELVKALQEHDDEDFYLLSGVGSLFEIHHSPDGGMYLKLPDGNRVTVRDGTPETWESLALVRGGRKRSRDDSPRGTGGEDPPAG